MPFYINGPSLSSATSVFDDAGLTTPSANGFYSDGIVSREQIDGILLPQQICTACCSDPCSSWTVTALIGTVTIRYTSCAQQAVIDYTVTGPFDETLCVVNGSIPQIIFGKASLTQSQSCGCCTQDCNTYRIFGIIGYAVVQYVDCSNVQQTNTYTVSDTLFNVKNNTTPIVIEGTGFIGFYGCGVE